MLLDRLFRPRQALTAGRALYARAVEQSRAPALYAELGAPDTVEGRFELYSLHVVLLLDRLRGQGDEAAEVSQALFDTYLSALDNSLREMGVGDLSVGKRMRKLGEAFYGRVQSYETALAALPDRSELEALVGRTVYAGLNAPPISALVDYFLNQRAALAGQPLDAIVAGDVTWGAL